MTKRYIQFFTDPDTKATGPDSIKEIPDNESMIAIMQETYLKILHQYWDNERTPNKVSKPTFHLFRVYLNDKPISRLVNVRYWPGIEPQVYLEKKTPPKQKKSSK